MATAQSYIGRSIDLSAYYGIKERGEFELIPALFTKESSGQVITGIQKLVQRWLITLLTPVGSIRFRPERGTNFITDTMFIRTETDVQTAFYMNGSDAEQQLLLEETDDMDDQEKFKSATLLGIVISKDMVSLNIEIESKAGDQNTLYLPLTSSPIVIK